MRRGQRRTQAAHRRPVRGAGAAVARNGAVHRTGARTQAAADGQGAGGGGAFYAGSLLQLDFGEAEQEKSVRIVDLKPRLPADTRDVRITGGTRPSQLAVQARRAGGPPRTSTARTTCAWPWRSTASVQSLFEQVSEVLPNAIDVMAVRTDIAAPSVAPTKVGLEPHELLTRTTTKSAGSQSQPTCLRSSTTMYEEAQGATA